eukprot:EST42315.1 Hypothetical protein SS50377_18184 [Spironucleus salmonicida]
MITTIKLLYLCTNKVYWKNNIKLLLFFWCVPFYDEIAYKDYFVNCIINYYLLSEEIVESFVNQYVNANWVDLELGRQILMNIQI